MGCNKKIISKEYSESSRAFKLELLAKKDIIYTYTFKPPNSEHLHMAGNFFRSRYGILAKIS